jgi:hypothetical protein
MTAQNPWAWRVPWPRVQDGSVHVDVVADEATRKAIARFLGLENLSRLSARLELHAWFDGAEIAGEMTAELTRLCGLTLEPFEVRLDEPMKLRALPVGSAHAPPPPAGEVDLELEEEDPPEMCAAEALDLGELTVQTLALALDPFPRKPGAVFEAPARRAEDSPFGVLAHLNPPKD